MATTASTATRGKQSTGNAGTDTFIIADYSGDTLEGQTFNDESVDTIMDFETGVDRIDLSEFGVNGPTCPLWAPPGLSSEAPMTFRSSSSAVRRCRATSTSAS